MSYSSSDFADDVTQAAYRLMTRAEQKAVDYAEDPAPASDAVRRILNRIPTPKPIKRGKQAFQEQDPIHVQTALNHLRMALVHLKFARANRTAERVRLAISSCKGAVRAVEQRESRAYERQRAAEEASDREKLIVQREGK